MVPNIAPPFRADHIGSLKRPQYLLDQRKQFDHGACTRADLKAVEDQAIREEVDKLRQVGIKSFTDGEYRRHMFWDGFFDNLTGMKEIENPGRELFKMWVPDVKAFFESHADKPGNTMVCDAKLVREKPMYRPEFEYTASIVKPEEVKQIKITLASPVWYHLRHGEHAYPKEVYANDQAYFADIAKAYREELHDLYDAGCRNVQFDDPMLAYFCSEAMLTGMKEEGVDSDALLDLYIQTYNKCLEGRPKDMTVGIHLCRGNFKDGKHFAEGGYDRISSKLFKELNADTYYLEYDTERAGTFEPLADLPKPKTVVLGLVTSKFPQMENPDELIKRIKEAASCVAKGSGETEEEALQRLCISPQCGFASHSEGNPITADVMHEKLSLCVETAKKVWQDA